MRPAKAVPSAGAGARLPRVIPLLVAAPPGEAERRRRGSPLGVSVVCCPVPRRVPRPPPRAPSPSRIPSSAVPALSGLSAPGPPWLFSSTPAPPAGRSRKVQRTRSGKVQSRGGQACKAPTPGCASPELGEGSGALGRGDEAFPRLHLRPHRASAMPQAGQKPVTFLFRAAMLGIFLGDSSNVLLIKIVQYAYMRFPSLTVFKHIHVVGTPPLLISRNGFHFPELTRFFCETLTHPQPLAPPCCFPPPWIRLLSGPHRRGIIRDASSSGWITSHSKLSSRSIQVVAHVRRSFLLGTE